MISAKIDQVREAHLQALIDGKVEEGQRLDFKRKLPGTEREDKKAFASDVCAMANAAGGDIVYGLDEDGSGRAAVFMPQDVDPDKETLRLTHLVADLLEPRLHGVGIAPVALAQGGFAFVVRVPRSGSGIHRVVSSAQFYVRQSRSNLPLDVPGIIGRVADQLGRADRVEDFFARRYANVLIGQYPIALRPGPKFAVHLLPLRDFLSGEHVDVHALTLNDVPYIGHMVDLDHQPCADGRIFWNVTPDGATSSTMVMHSGVVEAVLHLDLSGQNSFDMSWAEDCVLDFFVRAFGLPAILEVVGLPLIARLTLLGTQGMPQHVPNSMRFQASRIRQLEPVLVLPETLIESKEVLLDAALHPAFTRMWNAWGSPRSPNYRKNEETGVWRRTRPR